MYDVLTLLAMIDWKVVESGLTDAQLPEFHKFKAVLSKVMTKGTSFFATEHEYSNFIHTAEAYVYNKPNKPMH